MILYLLRFDEHYYTLRADEWYKKPGLGAPQLRLPRYLYYCNTVGYLCYLKK